MEYNFISGKQKQHRNLIIANYFSCGIDDFDLNDLKLLLVSNGLISKYAKNELNESTESTESTDTESASYHYILIDDVKLYDFLLNLKLLDGCQIINTNDFYREIDNLMNDISDKIIKYESDNNFINKIKIGDTEIVIRYKSMTNTNDKWSYDYSFIYILLNIMNKSTHGIEIIDIDLFKKIQEKLPTNFSTNYIKFWIEFNPLLIKYFTTKKSDCLDITRVYTEIKRSDPRLLSINSILKCGVIFPAICKFIYEQCDKNKLYYSPLEELLKINEEICNKSNIDTVFLIKQNIDILTDQFNNAYYIDIDSLKKIKPTYQSIYFKDGSNNIFKLNDLNKKIIEKLNNDSVTKINNVIQIINILESINVTMLHYNRIFEKPILRDRDRVCNMFNLDSVENMIMIADKSIYNNINKIINVTSYGYYYVEQIDDDIYLSRYREKIMNKYMY